MEKKYKTEKEGNLLRIIALKDFSDVNKGDKGGLIENEYNLSQDGDCWVYEGAKIFDDARVFENAKVYNNARVDGHASVYGNAKVYGFAWVSGGACVFDNADVHGRANILKNAQVYGDAEVEGNARVTGGAKVSGNARVFGLACVFDCAWVSGNAKVHGKVFVGMHALVYGDVKLWSTKNFNIAGLIKDKRDYIIFVIKRDFYVFPSNIENIFVENTPIVEKDYIKNIQTIRQLYRKEV